jgi:hypothetical protein
MVPAPVVDLISRLIGYLLFLLWCAAVAAALSVVGLFRLGRLASRLGGREPAPTLP